MNDDPAAFLKLPASDEGKLLTEQADQFSGSLVPFWMFAEVAVRQRKTSAWIADRRAAPSPESFDRDVRSLYIESSGVQIRRDD